jgi:hypothetical protein
VKLYYLGIHRRKLESGKKGKKKSFLKEKVRRINLKVKKESVKKR